MLICAIAALALVAPRAQATGWTARAAQLRSVAETYRKWGITFKVDAQHLFSSGDSPLPAHLEMTGSMQGPDTVVMGVDTSVGARQEVGVHLGGEFKLDPQGAATSGTGALYVQGRGIAGKFRYDRRSGMQFEAGLEESFYSLGIKLGEADAGPMAVGLKLGPLTVELDPVKWARRFREMGPAMARSAGGKIGGVSLAVDTDALASALVEAAAPPERFLRGRQACSLRAALHSRAAGLGQLTAIDGVLVDDDRKDLILVGHSEAALAAMPMEFVTAVARSVYVRHTFPFVSIDPSAADFSLPHHARVGGVGPDLSNSSMVAAMLAADYSMKRLALGADQVDGVPELMDLSGEMDPRRPVATRFWISPQPPVRGDLLRATSPKARYYSFSFRPRILSEAMVSAAAGAPGPVTPRPGEEGFQAPAARLAWEYTRLYGQIETARPASRFGQARQLIELTGVMELLRRQEHAPWIGPLLAQVARLHVKQVSVPTEFAGLASRKGEADGVEYVIHGGMQTAVDLPEPTRGGDLPSAAGLHIDPRTAIGSVAPMRPMASSPAALSTMDAAEEHLREARLAFDCQDFGRAATAAAGALSVRPGWVPALRLRIAALFASGNRGAEAALDSALAAVPNSPGLLTVSGYVHEAAGEWLELAKVAERLIRVASSASEGYAFRAHARYRGSDPQCLADWATAIRLSPQDPDLHLARAAACLWQGRSTEALADLDAVLRLNPCQARALMARGELLLNLGRPSEAAVSLRGAQRLEPANWLASDLLGRALYAAGDHQGAIDAMTRALRARPAGGLGRYTGDDDEPPPALIRVPIDPLEEFIDSPDVERKHIIQEIALCDPLVYLVRGMAEYRLARYPDALRDLEMHEGIGERYRSAMAPRMKQISPEETANALADCRSRVR